MKLQSMKHLKKIDPDNFPAGDKLENMLRLQKELNQSVYPKVMNNLGILSSDEEVEWLMSHEEVREKLSKEYLLAIIREACEALDLLNSKAWKDKKHPIDLHEFKYELIDKQHFLNSLYDIWEMSADEVFGIFMSKYRENVRRHKDGY